MARRITIAAIVSLALATAIHLDWHLARPAHHPLSLGLSWHWLLGIPVFALVAWYVGRAWPAKLLQASVAIVGSAFTAAGVIEPAYEYVLEDAPLEWAFGDARNSALVAFAGVGLLTYCIVLALMTRGRPLRTAADSALQQARQTR